MESLWPVFIKSAAVKVRETYGLNFCPDSRSFIKKRKVGFEQEFVGFEY